MALATDKNDVKPTVFSESKLKINFEESNLVQIFDSMIVCARFEGERSDFTVQQTTIRESFKCSFRLFQFKKTTSWKLF